MLYCLGFMCEYIVLYVVIKTIPIVEVCSVLAVSWCHRISPSARIVYRLFVVFPLCLLRADF